MYFWWLILLFISPCVLRHLVPNPGDMVLHTPQGDAGFSTSGARVATGTSTSGRSVSATLLHARPGAKFNEVWATIGYGQIVDPSRCKRIKRSFTRACRRAFHIGCTQYRGRDFWSLIFLFGYASSSPGTSRHLRQR